MKRIRGFYFEPLQQILIISVSKSKNFTLDIPPGAAWGMFGRALGPTNWQKIDIFLHEEAFWVVIREIISAKSSQPLIPGDANLFFGIFKILGPKTNIGFLKPSIDLQFVSFEPLDENGVGHIQEIIPSYPKNFMTYSVHKIIANIDDWIDTHPDLLP